MFGIIVRSFSSCDVVLLVLVAILSKELMLEITCLSNSELYLFHHVRGADAINGSLSSVRRFTLEFHVHSKVRGKGISSSRISCYSVSV